MIYILLGLSVAGNIVLFFEVSCMHQIAKNNFALAKEYAQKCYDLKNEAKS